MPSYKRCESRTWPAGTGREALTAALKLIGYDEKTDAFDVQKATAPHIASAYLTAANQARTQSHQPELADRIMDQAVKVNPDSADAYLARGQYCLAVDQGEKGARDIEKAYKLKPDDADVLLAMAGLAETQKKNDRAVEFLKTGKAKYPDDPRFYQSLGSLAMQKEDYKAALDVVNEGLNAVPGHKGQGLLFFKADLQFLANDIPGVRETMEAMRKARFRSELIDFEDARIMLVQGKWNDASKSLQRLRSKLGDMGGLTSQMDVQLGSVMRGSARSTSRPKRMTSCCNKIQRTNVRSPASSGSPHSAARGQVRNSKIWKIASRRCSPSPKLSKTGPTSTSRWTSSPTK